LSARPWKRVLLIGAGLLIGLPLLIIAGFVLFFDADAFRPRLAEAVQRATGRDFRIEGPLRLSPSLSPTISVDGLVLANVEGGSHPEMLRIGHAELRLALWPLATGRIEVRQLTLEGGRLLLERENWRFARPAASGAAPAATPSAPARPLLLDLRSAILRDWSVNWAGEEIRIPQMRLNSAGAGQPLDVAATLAGRGTEATVEGRVASPMLLAETAPWPFRLTATLPGARLTAEGERSGADWRAAVSAEIPRLDSLDALAGRPLPPLTGISLRAQAALANGAPSLERIEGRIAGGEFAGATLGSATFAQATLEGPLRVDAAGRFREQALTVTLDAVPAALIAGTAAPITLNAAAAGATLALTGTWPGVLRLEAAVPDLAALSPLAGRPLPPLRDAALRADVTAEGPMFREGARLGQFSFTSSGGDLAGTLVFRWVSLPSIVGRVNSTRIDLAAFRMPAMPSEGAPPAVAAPAPPSPGPARVIPDTPVDMGVLRRFNADVAFQLAELVDGTMVLREVQGRLVNQGGRARLDPFAATLPGGRLDLRVAADATADPPALQVAGGGQGLDPVAMFGPQSPFTGQTDLDLDLRAQGTTTRALAASATGHFGLAVTGGQLAGAPARALAQLPGFGGGVPVSCLALRADADRGLVRLRTLYLEGGAGRLSGEGGMSLRDETLAIRLNTDLRVAGVRVRAPVPLTGTLAAPRLELAGLTEGALSGDLGRQLERAVPGLGALLPQQVAGPALPDCATALRTARNGREGPVPAPVPDPAPQGDPSRAETPPPLNNLLRGLLGR